MKIRSNNARPPLGRLLAGRPELIALLAATLAASAPQPVKQDPDNGQPQESEEARREARRRS